MRHEIDISFLPEPPASRFLLRTGQPRAVTARASPLGRARCHPSPGSGIGRQRAEGDAPECRPWAARLSAREHAFRHHRGHTGRSKLRPLDGKFAGARSNDSRRQLALLHAQSRGECLDHDGCGGTNAELCSDQGSAGTDFFQPSEAPASAVWRLQTPQPHRNMAHEPASPAMLHMCAPRLLYAVMVLHGLPHGHPGKCLPGRNGSDLRRSSRGRGAKSVRRWHDPRISAQGVRP